MFFAVALVLLAPLALGVVDIYMSTSQRARLQDALDAAALYVARSGSVDADEIQAIGLRALNANLSDSDQARLVHTNFVLNDSTIVASAEISSDSIASELWNHGNMTVNTNAVRNSVNLEVAVVLDITGSMKNDMDDLKEAAEDLVDLVVQDVQTPYYSKLAIVPYSNSVNVGAYADAVRGPVNIPVVTGATNTKNVKVKITTSDAHGLSDGDKVKFSDVKGMTQLNGNTYTITNSTATTFDLSGTNGKDYSKYTSGGLAHCYIYGCEYYTFTNADWNSKTFAQSTCASERTGTHKYNDTAPSTAYVGRVYAGSSNSCPSAEIMPLSSDKDALKTLINSLDDGGSTAGHLGIAWGWYMVSPNFGYVWSDASSRPAAYGTDELLKVVILMTDGEFNTAYCNGVIAKNSGSGSGSDSDHINCNATNGTSGTQATALCDAMKQQDIVIYTVGFRISEGSTAAGILSGCATDAEHQYLPSSGTALQDAFRAIGQDINSLRLSH
ncbi:MAG: ubiquitin-activating E1 FCCH domain-containing protein [Phenylobacterium sp.]|uniref:ubiquitin-activating E1 FCCH domain-containing protein n=1 Tax=Phenylobacterium sp. TaxID=1871053 RepID=UPI00391D7006